MDQLEKQPELENFVTVIHALGEDDQLRASLLKILRQTHSRRSLLIDKLIAHSAELGAPASVLETLNFCQNPYIAEKVVKHFDNLNPSILKRTLKKMGL